MCGAWCVSGCVCEWCMVCVKMCVCGACCRSGCVYVVQGAWRVSACVQVMHTVCQDVYMSSVLCVGVHMHVKAKEQPQVLCLRCYPPLKSVFIGLEFTKQTRLDGGQLPGSTILYLHCTAVTVGRHHTQLNVHVF